MEATVADVIMATQALIVKRTLMSVQADHAKMVAPATYVGFVFFFSTTVHIQLHTKLYHLYALYFHLPIY